MHDVALTYSLASNYIGYQCRYLRMVALRRAIIIIIILLFE